MPKKIEIVNGKPGDFLACRKLAREVGFNMWANNSIDLWAKRERSIFLVAKSGGKIVGFILSRDVLGESEILVICVKDGYRNQGVGSDLILGLIERAREQDTFRIFLEVNHNNLTARKLYSKFEFRTVGVRRKYYDNKDDAFVMSRNIDENFRN